MKNNALIRFATELLNAYLTKDTLVAWFRPSCVQLFINIDLLTCNALINTETAYIATFNGTVNHLLFLDDGFITNHRPCRSIGLKTICGLTIGLVVIY